MPTLNAREAPAATITPMNSKRLADAHRALRRRLQLTQREVAGAAHISRNKVSFIENQRLGRLMLPEVERSFAVLDASLAITVNWRGAGVDRLLDEGHATLVGVVAEMLRKHGWEVEIEVTFAEFGDRGSIDILAWHPNAHALLIVEIKTEIGSMDGLLRPLDVKVRLAPKLAHDRFGWTGASAVGRLVVLPENRAARRTAERQSRVLDTALPDRSWAVRRWLARPIGNLAGLWFLTSAQTVGTKSNPSAVRRVRRPKLGAA